MVLFSQMFAVGLATSLHCVAMCGGLAVACAVRSDGEASLFGRLVPHVAYQAAKVTSYAMVALVLGGLVAIVGLATDLAAFRAWLMVAAGSYMILLGLSMTGRMKVLRYLTPKPSSLFAGWLKGLRRSSRSEGSVRARGLVTPLALGALTGLMPCAPLIAAQAAAASSASPLDAALAMIGFGLGTAPLMLAFGVFSSLASSVFRRRLQIVSAIAVIVFGSLILDHGLVLVGSPLSSVGLRNSFLGAGASAGSNAFRTGEDGVVEVPLVIRDTQYVPHDVVIPARRPVRLLVDRQEDMACSDQLAIPAFRLLADLAPNGVTKVDVPPMDEGTYTLTCGMGMMSGSIVVVAGGMGSPAGAGAISTLVPVLVVIGVVSILWAAWRVAVHRSMPRASGRGQGRDPA